MVDVIDYWYRLERRVRVWENIACVASVSSRVIARKLELSSQRSRRPRAETLATQARENTSRSGVACSRLRDGGGKSFSNKKCEKRAGARERQGIFPVAIAPFTKPCASYFRFARFNTFPLYYLRAWHRLLWRSRGNVHCYFKLVIVDTTAAPALYIVSQ